MPIRIPVIYPRYQRPYANRAPAGSPFSRGYGQGGQPPRGGGGGKGAIAPGAIDTAPTGSAAGDFVKAINATIQGNRQNALANKLMNIQTPPRAGAVGPVVNPATGQVRGNITPTTGTVPTTGGMAELQLRQQMDQQNLADQLQRAKIASQLALAGKRGQAGVGDGGQGGSGSASRWKAYLGGQGGQGGGGGKGGKPAAYQPGSSTADQPNYYNFGNQRADVDQQYTKGTYDRLLANSGQFGEPDKETGIRTAPDGSTMDKNGNVTIAASKSGNYPGAYIPADEVKTNMARYDGTLVQNGKAPRFSDNYLKTQNPTTGLPNGDPANPYMPTNTTELTAVPPGKSFVNPQDGKTYTKAPPGQPAAPTVPAPKTSSAEDLSAQPVSLASAQPQPTPVPPLLQPLSQPTQSSTGGDQGQDYTGGQPQPPVDQSQLMASNTPPGIFNIGQPTGGDLPPDQQLGDEIKRTQIANSLQGVA